MNPTVRTTDLVHERLAAAEAAYVCDHPASRSAIERLGRSLPGGDTRSTTWFEPFPLVIDRAAGAELRDLDGHTLIDFLNNYTSLVHGHAPPAVTSAIAAVLDRGTAFATPILEQGDLADRLTTRIAAAERVRFTNSGTEANMLAARIARAHTNRGRLAVARHSYHGSWDALDWQKADTTGTIVIDANDPDATAHALDGVDDLAAIFVEPVLGSGGVIPLDTAYLRYLRDYTHSCGALLVFDEVMTFRLAPGGYQEIAGVAPDLTTLAKLIGGGLPIGAVGGLAAIMDITNPSRPNSLPHSGTFNGNRLAMVAGAATLDALDRTEIDRINQLGQTLRAGIARAAEAAGLPVSVTGYGSLMNIHSLAAIQTPADANAAAQQPLKRLLHLTLLAHGVFTAPRGELCISTAMDSEIINRALRSISLAFEHLT